MLLRQTTRRIVSRGRVRSVLLQGRHLSEDVHVKPRKALQDLPQTPVRTRFAPSPTGYLHLGSLRTALFNYLLAKATDGQFVLRIEDTDQARTIAGAEACLYDDLKWAGLQWDEGPQVDGPYGPYRQSDRKDIYQNHANELLRLGNAYRCFCSATRLAKLAEERNRLGLPTNYDRVCSEITHEESERRVHAGEPYTIRFRSPRILPAYQDLVYGWVGKRKLQRKGYLKDEAQDDFILLKSDGMPTYHLANVVDDHLMRITHVIRATEWMPSTPKHLAIYDALQWDPPSFAHVGLLVDSNAQKLSKRKASTNLQSFKEDGIFPEALTNYLALLGWSHQNHSDLLPMKDLIAGFNLKFTKGNTVFDLRKLKFLQQIYARKYVEDEGVEFQTLLDTTCGLLRAQSTTETLFVPPQYSLETYVAEIMKADVAHAYKPQDFLQRNHYFFTEDLPQERIEPTEKTSFLPVIGKAIDMLSKISPHTWSIHTLKEATDTLALNMQSNEEREDAASGGNAETDRKRLKAASARVSRALRLAVMAGSPGPPMIATMKLIGRECTIARLQAMYSSVH